MSDRIIHGSSFERPDDDRTWDEQGIGDELWDGEHVDDDLEDYPTEDPALEVEAAAEARRAQAARRAAALEAKVAAKPAPAPGVYSADPEVDTLEALRDVLESPYRDDPEVVDMAVAAINERLDGIGTAPVITPPAPSFLDGLTEVERQHLAWLDAGRTQAWIAAQLGISQVAVSKREARLRAKVDTLHRAAFGRPYPWPGGLDGPRRPGVRARL